MDPAIRTCNLIIIMFHKEINKFSVLTPASNNFEDLEFDKFTLKIFDPSTEKKYNLFRIPYFIKIIPKVLIIFSSFFGLYSLFCYIFQRDTTYSISRLILLLIVIIWMPTIKTFFFQIHFYHLARTILLIIIASNFIYFMILNAGHFTYNFILVNILITYNLNLGAVFSLIAGSFNLILFFVRLEFNPPPPPSSTPKKNYII